MISDHSSGIESKWYVVGNEEYVVDANGSKGSKNHCMVCYGGQRVRRTRNVCIGIILHDDMHNAMYIR